MTFSNDIAHNVVNNSSSTSCFVLRLSNSSCKNEDGPPLTRKLPNLEPGNHQSALIFANGEKNKTEAVLPQILLVFKYSYRALDFRQAGWEIFGQLCE